MPVSSWTNTPTPSFRSHMPDAVSFQARVNPYNGRRSTSCLRVHKQQKPRRAFPEESTTAMHTEC